MLALWMGGVSPMLGLAVAGAAVVAAIIVSIARHRADSAWGDMRKRLELYARGEYAKAIAAEGTGTPGAEGGIQATLDAALKRLRSDLGFAQGVLNGMATPCVVVDTDEVLRFTNQNLLHILQHDGKPADYYGQNVAYFFYGDASRPTVLGTALRENRAITKEVELTGRKGGKRSLRIDASPLFDLQGKLMGSLCVYADLTELRAQEANLLEVNARVSRASEQADGISGQVAQAAQQLSGLVSASHTGAQQQSERITQTVTAMEQMNATVLEVARNAAQAAETSGRARAQAEDGSRVVEKVVDGIGQVQREALTLKSDMANLGQQAESIGRIMNVISDIADQTNLLALNAAIEAARAGEAGRGFAVVADEVRKLAEKTMTATKEVGDAISGIQQGTASSINSVERAVQRIDEATTLAGQSGQSLREIVRLVEAASDQVRSIATASEEQSAASEQIGRSVDEVSSISHATADDMTQAARAVEELAGRAGVLRDVIREMQGNAALEGAGLRALG